MDPNVITIPLPRLVLAFVPVLATVVLLARWSLDVRDASIAVARMLLQLLASGALVHAGALEDLAGLAHVQGAPDGG